MLHATSQSASFSKSAVNVPKQRTDSASRSGGTATKIWVAPISIPAALRLMIGNLAIFLRAFFTLVSFNQASWIVSPDRAQGSLPNEIAHRSFRSGQRHHCIEHEVWNHTAGRASYAPVCPRP